MKNAVVLGATGSLGKSFLNALEQIPDLHVIGLSCNKNTEKLEHLARKFRVRAVASTQNEVAGPWQGFTGPSAQSAMIQAVQPDIVVNTIAGIDGLEPSITAIRNGSGLVMGCKEAIVAAGPFLKKAAFEHKTWIISADSEHVAAQILLKNAHGRIKKLVLTGTGGALRDMPESQRETASPDQVMSHPVWSMGPKITVDSATMMNKALEVIEAAWLFDLPPEKIETRISRSGTIHAALELTDKNVMVHQAEPSMQAVAQSILTGTTWGRIITGEPAQAMLREMPGIAPKSCARLGHLALKKGGDAHAVLVGADRAVVEAFLQKRIEFGRIRQVLFQSLGAGSTKLPDSIQSVMAAFNRGYKYAWSIIRA